MITISKCWLFVLFFFLMCNFNFPLCPWNEILTNCHLEGPSIFHYAIYFVHLVFVQNEMQIIIYFQKKMGFLKRPEQKEYCGYHWQMATASTVSIQKCFWEQDRSPCFQCWKPNICPLQCVQSASVTERSITQKDLNSLGKFCHFHMWFIKTRQSYSLFFCQVFFCVFVCQSVGVFLFLTFGNVDFLFGGASSK